MKQWIFLGLSFAACSTMQLIGSVQDEPGFYARERAEELTRLQDPAQQEAEAR